MDPWAPKGPRAVNEVFRRGPLNSQPFFWACGISPWLPLVQGVVQRFGLWRSAPVSAALIGPGTLCIALDLLPDLRSPSHF